jgi:hypothetical protein
MSVFAPLPLDGGDEWNLASSACEGFFSHCPSPIAPKLTPSAPFLFSLLASSDGRVRQGKRGSVY